MKSLSFRQKLINFFLKDRKFKLIQFLLFPFGIVLFSFHYVCYIFKLMIVTTFYQKCFFEKDLVFFEEVKANYSRYPNILEYNGYSPTLVAMYKCFDHYRMKLFFQNCNFSTQVSMIRHMKPEFCEYILLGLPIEQQERLIDRELKDYRRTIMDIRSHRIPAFISSCLFLSLAIISFFVWIFGFIPLICMFVMLLLYCSSELYFTRTFQKLGSFYV